MDNITFKYFMQPEKDQATLGNYWWVVRLRPQGGAKKYEYMINKDYSFSRMSWDFAQHRTSQLAANRWYYEGPIEKTLASCLYPYHQYCPDLDIDFRRCNINLGLNDLQYMEESKEPPRNPQCLSPIRREDKKREPHDAVQLLVNIGAIPDSTKLTLEEYLRELEISHSSTQASLKINPFATAHRFLLMHKQRLTAIIKAIKNVLNPPRQHGSYVNSLPDTDMNEPEDNEAEDNTSGKEENGEKSPSQCHNAYLHSESLINKNTFFILY
jgi:hypothetical protein